MVDVPSVEAELEADEGRHRLPYKDSRGIWTIGCGFNLAAHGFTPQQIAALHTTGWTDEQIDAALDADVEHAKAFLRGHLQWWPTLDNPTGSPLNQDLSVRQRVILNMAFNLGVGKLMTFTTFLGMVQQGHYIDAALDMLHTPWAAQVGNRAARLAFRMRTGTYA